MNQRNKGVIPMESSSSEHPILSLPQKTPRGWYIVHQPDYKTPNVFNLHERGMFTARPLIRGEYGARILTDENLQIAVQYMYLTEESLEDRESGIRFSWINKHGLVSLTRTLLPKKAELKRIALETKVEEEIHRVAREWASSFSSGAAKADTEEVTRALNAAVERGKDLCRQWLLRSNRLWIEPLLPRMIQNFKRGLHERVGDTLFKDYLQRGGEETEAELIRKINLFVRLYESDGLVKPNGAAWQSEDELWDCWIAFAGSESEGKRICETIKQVLLPLKEDIESELSEAA
jgi:hypothetical protein